MTRDEMLDAAMEFVAREGLTDFSLRACAAAIGTSHRMLAYYFGSREGLVIAIADAAAARFRGIVEEVVAGRDLAATPPTGEELDALLDHYYHHTDVPGLLPLLAEVTMHIARNPGKDHGDVRGYADLMPLWRPIITQQLGLAGLPEAQAEARLRLAIAVMVGMCVDYLGTRDKDALIALQREWFRLNHGV